MFLDTLTLDLLKDLRKTVKSGGAYRICWPGLAATATSVLRMSAISTNIGSATARVRFVINAVAYFWSKWPGQVEVGVWRSGGFYGIDPPHDHLCVASLPLFGLEMITR